MNSTNDTVNENQGLVLYLMLIVLLGIYAILIVPLISRLNREYIAQKQLVLILPVDFDAYIYSVKERDQEQELLKTYSNALQMLS
eukprot:Nk52_evm19s2039 gene=Nk52_evmTU19s2039